MYLIAESTILELPLAVAETLSELASICRTTIPVVCRIIRNERTTMLFQGVPAKIYKIAD